MNARPRVFGFLLLLMLVVVVVGVALLWPTSEEEDGGQQIAMETTGRGGGAAGQRADTGGENENPPEIDPASTRQLATRIGREAVAPTGLFIAGRVTDKGTGEPVASYHLRLSRKLDGPESWQRVCNESYHDQEGCFSIPLAEGGSFTLTVWSGRHQRKRLEDQVVSAEGGLCDLHIELDPGACISGRVVIDETGAPIGGAIVSTSKMYSNGLYCFLEGQRERCVHTESGAEGRFVLQGLSSERQKIVAVHPDFAEAWIDATPGEDEGIELRLKPGFHVFGLVQDDAGQPKLGVIVDVSGNDIPLARYVITGADGCYRSAPIRPGEVVVGAGPPEGADRDEFGFSTENKEAVIEDRDVEVNFGPLPEHITWRGTLFGYNGEPAPRAILNVRWIFDSPSEFKMSSVYYRYERCNDAGRFDLRKLLPGRYEVGVHLQEHGWLQDQLHYTLDTPGLLEQDIVLPVKDSAGLARIRGILIDGATGAPFVEESVYVGAVRRSRNSDYFTADMQDGGRFVLEDLSPGRYELFAQGKQIPSVRGHTVTVDAGETLDGVRIIVPAGGTLRLRAVGFQECAPCDFNLTVKHHDGASRRYRTQQIAENGTWEWEFTQRAGTWSILFSFKTLGFLQKTVELAAGDTAEVVLRRDELDLFSGEVSVEGRLARADGSASAGTWLSFYGRDIPGHGRRTLEGKTDRDGRFNIPGLRPGEWRVRVKPPASGSGMVILPPLIVPNPPSDPVRLDLVLPEGEITGGLYDKERGGAAQGSESDHWSVSVTRVSNDQYVAEATYMMPDNTFRLTGIPQGEFRLQIWVPGYEYCVSPAFEHSGSGVVDPGKIMLRPCGRLRLEVTDPAGEPIAQYALNVAGQEVHRWRGGPLSEAEAEFDGLSLGTVEVQIIASGYASWVRTVTFEPGRPYRLKAVLEPK